MSDLGECLAQVLFQLVFRALLTGLIILIDRQVISRRGFIIRWGVKIQNFLHLPQCMRVFADIDPGVLEDNLRVAAQVLLCAGIFFNTALLASLVATGGVWNGWFWGLGVIPPTCIVAVLWVWLALARRRLVRSQVRGYVGYGGVDACKELGKESGRGDQRGNDPLGLIHGIWTAPMLA